MSIRNTLKNKFIWLFMALIAVLTVSIIVIPPMVHLNFLKPKIENVILTQTGIPAQIHGNINFSMMGQTRIVAHNITIPNGVVSSCDFSIPFFDIFNLKNADIAGDIHINGASLTIDKIVPFDMNTKIIVTNSNIQFLNKEYNIIDAVLSKNYVTALVRTDQHKYEIKSNDNFFNIKNKNNDLNLSGELFADGTATAHIEITAQDINRWFEFEKPRITGQFPVIADMFWDGEYGVNFYNISANGITGSVDMKNDGYKIIKLSSQNAKYDLNFFLKNPDVLQNASFDLDFYGKLKLANKTFHHIKIVVTGSGDKIFLDTIIADNMELHGGIIDKDGAHNVKVVLHEDNINLSCLFNGTPTNWECDDFVYDDNIYGKLYVTQHSFKADISSSKDSADIKKIVQVSKKLGDTGIVNFDFGSMKGTININKNKYSVSYSNLNNKSLNWANIDLPFLPNFMKNENGTFTQTADSMIFVPNSKQWQLSTTKDFFILHGDNFKKWLPDIDLQSLRDLPYIISGNYKNGNISNLTLEIAGHRFTGTATNKSITLKTNILNMDSFINPYFTKHFEELAFFTPAPITIPFDLGINLALSADKLIYENQEFNNFVYSLRKNVQTFSITDSDRGNILTTIKKDNTKYTLNIQLNKFIFDEKLLPQNMPLNISDTVVTAEIKLNTSGIIAHDIIDNISGTFDMYFEGGKLYGFGFDDFYASAPYIKTLNGEEFLDTALRQGITTIKKMHINGIYNNGDIKTLRPLTLSMKHVDASGTLEIKNDEMFAKLQLVLRGTSSGPEPIDITIYPNNERNFSLSQIMMHFDPEYMREFVKSHNKF